jgi:hypothetical protein
MPGKRLKSPSNATRRQPPAAADAARYASVHWPAPQIELVAPAPEPLVDTRRLVQQNDPGSRQPRRECAPRGAAVERGAVVHEVGVAP